MPDPKDPRVLQGAVEHLREKRGFWVSQLLTGCYLVSPTYSTPAREFTPQQVMRIAENAGYSPVGEEGAAS